jgi:hypothetical protein
MLKKFNLLFQKSWFPVFLKIVTFIAFWIFITIGLSARSEYPVLDAQLYRTNLTNVFVWDTWWPLINSFSNNLRQNLVYDLSC